MRLDKFLKVSRIIKRRTVAKDACSGERVMLNGKEAKPSKEVSVGDVITIAFGEHEHSYKILEVRETTRKEDAEKLYAEL